MNSFHYTPIEFATSFQNENDPELLKNISADFSGWLREEGLPDYLLNDLQNIYIPFINLLLKNRILGPGKTPVIGICGAQGSGKSTFTSLLSNLLNNAYKIKSVHFSLDDFYLPLKEREKNSQIIHPLLKTRGVPGTHDADLGISTIEALSKAGENNVTLIPRFDKSIDDQYPQEDWISYKGRPDLIIFEGWCVGARPEQKDKLFHPVNELESQFDKDCSYRQHVNKQLAGVYQRWFSQIDFLVLLKVPSFSKVYEWRLLQEKKLRDKTKGGQLKIMNEEEISFFISHFERLTKHILEGMPEYADLVFEIGNNHQFEGVSMQKSGLTSI